MDEENFKKAVALVVENQVATVSMVQRRLRLGYSDSAAIIDRLEREGLIGPFRGMSPREVLIKEVPKKYQLDA